MPVIVQNNEWLLSETSSSQTYSKTFLTGDTYVDKNITVNIKAQDAVLDNSSVSVVNVSPTIVQSKGKYVVSIPGVNETATAVVDTPGWITELPNAKFTLSSDLELDATTLDTRLVEDKASTSGYSVYRSVATKGYNEENLTNDTDVYQGNFSY